METKTFDNELVEKFWEQCKNNFKELFTTNENAFRFSFVVACFNFLLDYHSGIDSEFYKGLGYLSSIYESEDIKLDLDINDTAILIYNFLEDTQIPKNK